MKDFSTNSPQQTYEFGEKIGERLIAGSIVCLAGEMGAGKTALTQGIVKGAGIETYVTSPTYTIINEYSGKLPIYHFDVFRLEDGDELYEIGFDEYLYGEGIVIIEWANLIKEFLPKEYLWIDIKKGEDFNDRTLTLIPKGNYYIELLKELKI
ncbi:MAG TPA: tRNA (adenosine(37)-N6)-threonylcarbamoyltransferase complex ATPase subunit type 1 TsaE [Eubacteriaceae bacterium]|jgi:tRNA threonylcarbamoyladenosine biosynthesis protein TsaE|nr:tRNA (adenosine(37)-N6)-threonylcarbamoyltransferase complex ATPase subunit type 1 TsaE [Eubacteriaceae bacterium]